MQKWEYKTFKLNTSGFMGGIVDVSSLNEMLNGYGEQGWEVTSTFATSQGQGYSREVVVLLKRPKEE